MINAMSKHDDNLANFNYFRGLSSVDLPDRAPYSEYYTDDEIELVWAESIDTDGEELNFD